jgi:AcrR family transcriptional regulator
MSVRNGSNGSEDPEKRQAILDQAILTFAECGFRGTDVQVIADGAGVGKGTVYRYFRSKEDLFWSATFEVMLHLEKHLFQAMEHIEGPSQKIRAAAIAYARFFEINPTYLEMFIQERAEFRGTGPESHREYHQKLIRQFENIFQEGIDSGELRPLDTYKTTLSLASFIYGIVVLGSHLTPLSAVQMAEHSIDIFFQGIHANLPSEAESSRCMESQIT